MPRSIVISREQRDRGIPPFPPFFPLFLFLLLCAFGCPVFAQTVPHVAGTFKTPENKTPSAAALRSTGTINSMLVYGSVDFVPYDSAGNRPTRILCGGITYVPQQVRAWIIGDGTLINSAGTTAYVDIVPTAGCTPAGLVIRATINLAPSSDGRRPAAQWKEDKAIPQQANVDWGSLAVAGIASVNYLDVTGAFTIAAGQTSATVSDIHVTSSNKIVLQEDSSLGALLGVTCNTTIVRLYAVTARSNGVSFTAASSAAPSANPACVSYVIRN